MCIKTYGNNQLLTVSLLIKSRDITYNLNWSYWQLSVSPLDAELIANKCPKILVKVIKILMWSITEGFRLSDRFSYRLALNCYPAVYWAGLRHAVSENKTVFDWQTPHSVVLLEHQKDAILTNSLSIQEAFQLHFSVTCHECLRPEAYFYFSSLFSSNLYA